MRLNMSSVCAVVLGAMIASWASPASARGLPNQSSTTTISGSTAPTSAAEQSASCEGRVVIAALTPIKLEIVDGISTKTNRTGETFAIRLAEPIMVDGRTLVPAGTPGMGEIVHAKKGGASGSAGELVMAARYLDVGGHHLRLRSMHVALTGKSREGTATAVGLSVGFVGMFISGGAATVAPGSIADAKTAEAFPIDPSSLPGSTSAPCPATVQ